MMILKPPGRGFGGFFGRFDMKILFLSKPEKVQKYTKDKSLLKKYEIAYAEIDASDDEIIKAGQGAEVIVADAIAKVSGKVIEGIPTLKMIHSEGVAFNSFDVETATKNHVYVSNCKGMNATAVAEQAILLMLGVLKDVVKGDREVRTGNQIGVKTEYMVEGNLRELGEMTVGLAGFGDIAKATAKLLKAFGCEVLYYASHRHSVEEEKEYGVEYAGLDDLLKRSDIVSLHMPVNDSTFHMFDDEMINRMKDGAILINTSRGELCDSAALIRGLESGKLSALGLDTLEQEPVKTDNPLFKADKEILDKMLLTCHIGGITAASFMRGYEMIWDDILKTDRGEKPGHVVNCW